MNRETLVGHHFGRYRITSKLGEGGMGVVYLARDTSLDRDVAIKVLRPELSSEIRQERFDREIHLAASLQHPHIVPVHDVGKSGEHLFFVMAYVKGQTLRERLREKDRLRVDEAVGYARQIADALDYAHRQGVVHRDIKPDNILLVEDKAMLMDFGLAMASEDSDEHRLTKTGTALGTPAYMSPEQATGANNADGRSDVYSLGCVVHEMLTGRPPLVGPSATATLRRQLADPAPSIRASRSEVPEAVDSAVGKALAKLPDERFQSARQFADALGGSGEGASEWATRARESVSSPRTPRARAWWAIAFLLGGLALAAAFVKTMTADREIEDPVVTVLPFSNLSADPDLGSIGIGMAQTLTTQLSAIDNLRMVASAQGTEAGNDVKEVAAELGVRYVVQGGVQSVEDRLQVSANIVRADGSIFWGGVYESKHNDLFELQRRLARGLSDAFALSLTSQQARRLDQAPTSNRDAYAEYLQGRAYLERRDVPGNLERATGLLTSAISKDAQFALAHAALGETYWQTYRNDGEAAWTIDAIKAAETGRELDPDHPYISYVLASIYEGTGRREDAIAELEHALEIRESDDGALALLGAIYGREGDIDSAVRYLERAIDGRPDYWGHHRQKGQVLFRAGRFQDAATAFRRVTELQPDSPWGFQQMGVSYHSMGNLELALENYERAIALGPSAGSYSNMGTIHYRWGEYEKAAQAYRQAIEIQPNSHVTHRNLGDTYTRLGRREDAEAEYLEALELATDRLRVNPQDGWTFSHMAVYEAKLGREREALRDLERAVELSTGDKDVSYSRAVVLALLGRGPDALDALEEAIEQGYSVAEIQKDEDLRSLHTSPRFQALIQ